MYSLDIISCAKCWGFFLFTPEQFCFVDFTKNQRIFTKLFVIFTKWYLIFTMDYNYSILVYPPQQFCLLKFIKSKLKFIKSKLIFIIIYNPHKVVLLVSKQDYTKVGHKLHNYYINALNNYTSVTYHLHYIL